ncbi:MAG: hypothetical protein B6I28_03780 [Fusobacteriia bacterium 4572_132]|nr:MAG: hypothetical protein B6I28_03780 [Fusobacteriia bacterium 4572_132]
MADNFTLTIPEDQELKKELIEKEIIPKKELTELEQQSEGFVQVLLKLDTENMEEKRNAITNIDKLGVEAQKESSVQSSKLKIPLKDLSGKSSDGKKVSTSLMELKSTVEALDPSEVDFGKKSFLNMFNPVKKYFNKYKSSEVVIDEIMKNLDASREVLRRDNISLEHDQEDMYMATKKLNKYISMGQYIDERLTTEVDIIENEDKRKFFMDEIQFPLRQRIMDLQQQLVVNQQGIFAIEVLKRNNKELIRGVDRAKLVTISALKVAIVVAQALADQKLVLDKINALNTTTSNLIAGTSERLKQQGVEIQKQASSSMLDVEKLKQSFKDINEAMDEITNFRTNALPKMSESIKEFEELTNKGEKKIKEIEKANKLSLPGDVI